MAPTTGMVVNIPPGPADLSNGAIELWPGSHRVGVFENHNGILSKPSGESRYRLKFAHPVKGCKGCEEALEGRDADANAEYVDGPIDYLFDPSRRIFLGRIKARAHGA